MPTVSEPRFRLSQKSKRKLDLVHPDLQLLVHGAIAITTCDFTVHEGARTIDQQAAKVKSGASWTMNSRHIPAIPLKQRNGRILTTPFSHAVDLVPFVNGNPVWDWPLCYKVAAAMHRLANKYDVAVVWGGVWDRQLNDLSISDLEGEVMDYCVRMRKLKKSAKIDGPHFELSRYHYPVK